MIAKLTATTVAINFVSFITNKRYRYISITITIDIVYLCSTISWPCVQELEYEAMNGQAE